jgi:hypothetical protein
MQRSSTITNLQEWKNNPINVGSIYIKPSEEEQTCSSKCFSYLWYFCCMAIPLVLENDEK